MPDDEGFRRYLQTGMAWFSVTQQKAEGILRDLADSGETAMGQAQKAFERIVERGRQGSEELRKLVRTEIRDQVAALGLATRDDIARLEAKLDAVPRPAPAPESPAAAESGAGPVPGPASAPPASGSATSTAAPGGQASSEESVPPALDGPPPTEAGTAAGSIAAREAPEAGPPAQPSPEEA